MFRFSIRELAMVTMIAAMAIGWWLDRRQIAMERDTAVQDYERLHSSYRNLDWEVLRKMVYPKEATRNRP
jgi:hypothetical protein